jgi:hypothetical protein
MEPLAKPVCSSVERKRVMMKMKRFGGLIGLLVTMGLTGAVHAACSFLTELPTGYSVQDSISDLAGQGNISCADIIGSDGMPMEEVFVEFQSNGYWTFPESEWNVEEETNYVTNTPDMVLQFPQGNGSRCASTYYRVNAIGGYGNIDGNVDVNDSIACTDNLVNVEEVIVEEPAITTTTGDGCTVTVSTTEGDITDRFEVFFATNILDGEEAICNATGKTQRQCVRACPEFVDVQALQDQGLCQSDAQGFIPLTDIDPATGETLRCTPCLTAAEAEAAIPGFDAGGKKLCWEYVNSVQPNRDPPSYRPHKKVSEKAIEVTKYNDCYEATTTILWYGIEIPFTYTTCD